MTDIRRNNQKRRPCSAWKRYGALVMAGALLAGTSAFAEPGSAALAEEIPLGRVGEAGEVAELIYRISQQKYLTGQDIALNGGFWI